MSEPLELDPSDILLNFTIPGASADVYQISFGDLDSHSLIAMQYVAIYSTAVAAGISFFFLLVVYTKKKTTPMYFLNQSILVALVIRSALFIAFQMSPISSVSTTFTGIPQPGSASQIHISIASNAFQVILIFLIQMSFTFQIYAIFRSPKHKVLGYCLTGFSSAMTLVVLGLYINNVVRTTVAYNRMFYNLEPLIVGSWVTDLPFIMFSVSINITSIILITKLLLAIRSRRYLGLRQFASYHILTITFSQTMIVPSILVLVNYGLAHNFRNINLLSSLSPILVALSLPFSSVWASTANNTRNLSSSVWKLLNNGDDSTSTDEATLNYEGYPVSPDKLVKFDEEADSLDEKTPHTWQDSFFGETKNIPRDMIEILRDEVASADKGADSSR